MTECERIIKEGLLPVSFFKSETICDFYVDEKQKKVWAVCLDLLIKFDSICRKYNLKYFVAFGSLLGIIRHKGFIPWDNDIDVCMLREDYNKLIKLKSEFKAPYFLQTPGNDKDYYLSFSKIRNSNTTAISNTLRYAEFNQGIFLDIFPLDNCLPEFSDENYKLIDDLNLENGANMRRTNPYPNIRDIERCKKYPKSNPLDVTKKIEKISTLYNHISTENVICAVVTRYKAYRMTFLRRDIEELKEYSLYNHKIFIPTNFDRILRTTYGNYMELPSISERSTHSDLILNPDIPYIDVLTKIRNNDKQNM